MDYFLALERQIPVLEAEQSLRWAQVALYPHLKSQDAQKWWNRTAAAITRASERAARKTGALFVVDGQAVGIAGLKRWLKRSLGRGLVA